MDRLQIVAMGDPAPQGSKKIVGLQKRGLARANLIDANGPKLRAWRSTVIQAARVAAEEVDWQMIIDIPVWVHMAFTMRPSIEQAKRISRAPGLPAPSHRMPDLDKLERAVLDSLTMAHVIIDDRIVARLTASKSYAGSMGAMEKPGVAIWLAEWKP